MIGITLLISFLIFSGSITALALGWIMDKRQLKGTCGGLATPGEAGQCGLCQSDPKTCPWKSRDNQAHRQISRE